MKEIFSFLSILAASSLFGQNAASNGLQQQLVEMWNNGAYQKLSRGIYTSDANGYVQHILGQQWNAGDWQTATQVLYTVTPQGNNDVLTNQQWDGSAWIIQAGASGSIQAASCRQGQSRHGKAATG